MTLDINFPMNGVCLPGCNSSMSGTVHCGQHTKAYAKLVYDGLKNAEKWRA